jgi:hypothetical protein
MNQNKSKNKILILLITILIILSSFVSSGNSTEFVDNAPQKISEILTVKTINSTFSAVNTAGGFTQPSSGPSSSGSGNIVVTDESGNESYPSMVVRGFNTLIAYENEGNGIYLRNTGQYGENWSAPAKLGTTSNLYYPSLCIRPYNKQVYGAFVSSNENFGMLGVFDIPDISDALTDNIETVAWKWYENGFYNFTNPDIVYHDNIKVPWIICSIGSTTNEQGPCIDTPMFSYLHETQTGAAWISWDTEYQFCKNVSLAMSDDSKKLYGICEIKNGTNQDLLFFTGIYKPDPEDPELIRTFYNKTFAGIESLTHPQIFVHNNKIYIVAESDQDGIVLFTSSTGFIQFTKKIVDVSMTSKYPLIYVNDTRIFCTFVNEGNIYLTSSSIGGVTWDIPIQLNSQDNTVVEKYRFADFPNKNLIVWTDNRDGNYNQYLCKLGQPELNLFVIPDSVSLETEGFTFIPTKNRIKFTIRNSGEAPVEKVKVRISYFAKGQLRETEHPGTIAYLEGDEEETLNRPLFRFTALEFFSALYNFAGIEYINVTVDPEGKYNEENTDDNTVSIPVDYEDIFPVLKGIEQIFL